MPYRSDLDAGCGPDLAQMFPKPSDPLMVIFFIILGAVIIDVLI